MISSKVRLIKFVVLILGSLTIISYILNLNLNLKSLKLIETALISPFNDNINLSAVKFLSNVNWTELRSRSKISTNCHITIALIICEDKNQTGIATSLFRQIDQAIVLIKSILLTLNGNKDHNNGSNECVKILIIGDNIDHFDEITRVIWEEEKWHHFYISKLKLQFIPLEYPSGTDWMQKLFRPCATLRLFLPDLLSNYNLLMYLDTDFILLKSVSDLWEEFNSFRSNKLAALAPCLFHYGTNKNSVPYYGTSGLNAGVMLMNLTKMREENWSRKIMKITLDYREEIKLADQDILNIYFHQNPNELHLLDCSWNFRPFQCHKGHFCLGKPGNHKSLIRALHGNALSFTPQGHELLFHSIYKFFENDITLSKTNNITKILEELVKVVETDIVTFKTPCSKYRKFKDMIKNHVY